MIIIPVSLQCFNAGPGAKDGPKCLYYYHCPGPRPAPAAAAEFLSSVWAAQAALVGAPGPACAVTNVRVNSRETASTSIIGLGFHAKCVTMELMRK